MNTPWGRRLGIVSVIGAVITAVLVVGIVKVAGHHDNTSARTSDRRSAVDVPVAASGGCAGTDGAAPAGMSHSGIVSSGVLRAYRLFVPQDAVATKTEAASAPAAQRARPLVVDLHGYEEGDDLHATFTGWEAKAQNVGAVVLTPEGQGQIKYWSLGYGKGIDDTKTISDLLDHIEQVACIDTNRVYADGYSNGAMLTSVLMCRLSDRIAAFGPVAGIWNPKGCAPKRAVPIMAFHGTADPFLPYNGGTGPGASTLQFDASSEDALSGFQFGPVPTSVKNWAHLDGCSSTPTTSQPGAHTTLTAYTRCRGGAEVELYTANGFGHTWPGSTTQDAITSITGPVDKEISATDLLWDFFRAHPLPR